MDSNDLILEYTADLFRRRLWERKMVASGKTGLYTLLGGAKQGIG